MKQSTAFLKRPWLRQTLMVFLAGVVLLITTACNNQTPPQAKGYESGLKGLPGRVEPAVSKDARIKPEPEQGMNRYSDVDPRTATKAAEQQAQKLVENAEQNVIDQTDDVGTNTRRILDKKNENVEHTGINLKEDRQTLGDKAQDIGDQLKSSAAKIGDNTKAATDTVTGNTQDVARGTQRAVDKTAKSANNTAVRTQSQANEAAKDTQQASENLFEKAKKSIQRASEDASDFAAEKTNQAAKSTRRGLEDAS